MGKPKGAKQRVVDYALSIHFGVAMKVDEIRKISVNEKVAWEGVQSSTGQISINQPNLFGGPKKEGGAIGTVYCLLGESDQVMPAELASKLGEVPETCPAFRDVTTLFFTGTGVSAANDFNWLPYMEFGVAPGRSGFIWSSNNPIVANTMKIRAFRAPIGLDPSLAIINGNRANPAHIIYECMTDADWGMGHPSTAFELSTWDAAAQTLYDEAFGLAAKWANQSEIEEFVSEIITHIRATVYTNPSTGLWEIKLYRDDYDPNAVRVIDGDVGTLTSFQRKMWGETINEIVVTYTDPDSGEDATTAAQDLANIAHQGGQIVSDSRNYYMIKDPALADKVCTRDLREAAAPLAGGTLEMDRHGWNILPGEVIRADFPDQKCNSLFMRVESIDYGKPRDSKIKISLQEDVYSLSRPPVVGSPSTSWIDPGEAPSPLDEIEIITLPAYFVTSTDLQLTAIDLDYPEVLAGVLGYTTSKDTRSYELLSEGPNAAGSLVFSPAGSKTIVGRDLLTVQLDAEAQSTLPGSTVTDPDRGPVDGSYLFIGTGDSTMEICLVSGQSGSDWIINRGLLDTVPQTWPVGTPVWFVHKGYRLVDNKTIRSAGETPHYKMLPQTSRGVLDPATAPEVYSTLSARPHLPLRPANVHINGVEFADVNVGGGPDIDFTWETRNRILEDGMTVAWDGGSIAPEYKQNTQLVFYDGSTEVYRYPGLWVQTSLTIPTYYFDKWASLRVEVISEREGLESLQNYSVNITGLANNPSAPDPPAPPDPGEPPSPVAAPAADAFTATGGYVDGENGLRIPTIAVAGQQDNLDADFLMIRYAKHGTTDLTYHPAVRLNGRYIKVDVTSVAPETQYDVEIAYEVDNILSFWRSLGTVTTGQLVASDTISVGGRAVEDILALLDEAEAAISTGLTGVTDLIDDIRRLSEAIILQGRNQFDIDAYVDGKLHLNGEPIVTAHLREVDDRVIGDTAILQDMTLLGAKNAAGTAWILDVNTVMLSLTESMSSRLTSLQSQITGNTAAITSEATTRASQDTALSLTITSLSATVTTNNTNTNARIDATNLAYATADTALATSITSLSATVTTNNTNTNARIDSTNIAYASADSALSSTITSLSAIVDANNININSRVDSTNIAFANADSALASSITSLSITVGGHTGSINSQAVTIGNITGQIYSRYMLSVNADGNIAAMTLLSSSGASNPYGSIVVFEAGAFLIRSASHPTFQPFFYDSSSGILYLNQVVVTSANIGTAQINTIHLTNGAVTDWAYYNTNRGGVSLTGSYVEYGSLVKNTNGTGRVIVIFRCDVLSHDDVVLLFRPTIDGSPLDTIVKLAWDKAAQVSHESTVVINAPGAGTHNFGISIAYGSGHHELYEVLLTVIEEMK